MDAKQAIKSWEEKNDTDAMLIIDGEVSYIPDNVKRLYLKNATILPKLPSKLEVLIANKVVSLPSVLPETLNYLSAKSVKELPKLPIGLTEVHTNASNRIKRARERDIARAEKGFSQMTLYGYNYPYNF